MTRELPEWIGKTDDTPVPPRVRLRVFERDGGRCRCGCRALIMPGQSWQADHIVALINGGENRETNLQTLLTEHHKNKTAADSAAKAKTYRIKKKNLGLKKKSRMAGSKSSPFKKKISGEVVRRDK